MQKNFWLIISAVLVITIYCSLLAGISLTGLSPEVTKTILNERFFRLILALCVGGSLSIIGLLYQNTLNNPLADPYLLGVSAGGAMGGICAMWLGLPVIPLSLLGSMAAFMLILFVSTDNNPTTLIINGTIVNAFCSAAIMVMVTLAGSRVQPLLFWLMGDLGSAAPQSLTILSMVLLFVIIVALIAAPMLDSLSLGDEHAQYLGIRPDILKTMLFTICALLTAIVVSAVGIIGFVGLIVPHIAKRFCGEKLAQSILPAVLIGGITLALADALSRVLIPGTILPIGVVTALAGTPAFLFLYRRLR